MSGLDLRQELLAAFEAEYREHLQSIRGRLAAGPVSGPALRDVFRRCHSLKGAARAVDLGDVEAIAHRLETLLHEAVERGQALPEAAAAALQRGLDAIEARMRAPEAAAATPEPADPSEADVVAEPAAAGMLRIPAALMDRLGETMQAVSTAMQQQEQAGQDLADAAADARALVRLWEEMPRGAVDPAAGGEIERRLRQLSRRLSARLRTRRTLDFALDQAVRALQAQSEGIALIAAESVFAPLAGMARDLAREAGGELDIRLVGLDLRAERRVLQALRDPAIQLLRNAVSHGLRAGPGRPANGRLAVVLSLALRAGRLELGIADDGPGPDLARIEQVARRRGLLPPGSAVTPPDERRLLSLVFEPGFSTAPDGDRLSGRGMGLSIVAEAARRLDGTALLRRGDAGGSAVLVSVPLAARRQSLLLVEAGGHLFGLPTVAVERLLHVRADRVVRPEGRPMLRLPPAPAGDPGGGHLLPLGSLSTLLGADDALAEPDAGPRLPTVLLSVETARFGLVVERLHDVRVLLVRAPDVVGIDRRLVAGIALAEQDRPVLVLEPAALIETLLSAPPARPPDRGARADRAAPRPQATILVVDDSITTRTLEKTILQAQGYRVLIAVDGLEALTVLRTAQWEVDVVVADVEMPRLDGFGLLAAMRDDPRLATIPTVLMTSRNAEADIRRGLELGARAYITKQDFDQGMLLSTVGQLLP